jgi:hypothetical protein
MGEHSMSHSYNRFGESAKLIPPSEANVAISEARSAWNANVAISEMRGACGCAPRVLYL